MMPTLSFPDSNNINVINNPSDDHIEAAVYSIPTYDVLSKVSIETKDKIIETWHIKDNLYHLEYRSSRCKRSGGYRYVITHYLSAPEIIALMQKCAKGHDISKDYKWKSYEDIRGVTDWGF